jgi:predicted MFS family arabinose efflux permease
MPWQSVFLVYAGIILLALFALPFIKAPVKATKKEVEESLSKILNIAVRDPSYILIFIGFFSCGFQLAFVTAHFPAFVTEACATIDPNGILAKMGVKDTADLGAVSIAVIGVFNIIGTITAGALGGRFSKRLLLAWIYLGRTVLCAWFILTPMTPTTVLIFSAIMGSLWLATVPLTSGLVAYIYGLRYMGTLYGLVFLSHQIGSFVGVWLGGDFYDRFGSYDVVWWVGVGTGLLSAVAHLPVKERPINDRPITA